MREAGVGARTLRTPPQWTGRSGRHHPGGRGCGEVPPHAPPSRDGSGSETDIPVTHIARSGHRVFHVERRTGYGRTMATPETVADRLERLAAAIRASPHNLVSARAREELLTRHIPECAAFAELLPPAGRVLDIGSGGGLPGLALAICRPGLRIELLEATRKKVDFLQETAGLLGLEVVVHHGRAEDLAESPLRETFDVVTARAVAPLARLVPLAAPFLAPGGRLYAIKGARWAEEVTAAEEAMISAGLRVVEDPATHPHLAPDEGSPHRPLVVMLGHRS